MRSGGRPAVSTMLWVPSCDSHASIYSGNSGLTSLAALAVSLPHSAGQNNAIIFFNFFICSQFWYLISSFPYFPLSLYPLFLPSVSSRPEWQLALGKPIRGWARWPTLPLLSDLAEYAAALPRFGTAPCGQRGQVSSAWLFWFPHTYWDLISDTWVHLPVHRQNGSGLFAGLEHLAES